MVLARIVGAETCRNTLRRVWSLAIPLEHSSATLFDLMSDEAMMAIVCARSDQEVFHQLVLRWQVRLTEMCHRLTGNLHDAEDAVQEAFSRAFTAREQFRGGAKFTTWMWRIAVNSAHDVRRRQARGYQADALPGELADHRGSPNSMEGEEVREHVKLALAELPDDLREVLVLRHYQNLKLREISDILNVPLGTVYSRLAEALSRLERRLQSLNG